MTTETTPTSARTLQELCGDIVQLPGDPGYDALVTPWNVAAVQRPAAVAQPRSTQDVVAIVRGAARLGLRVAPQSTGHGAGILATQPLDDVILVRTAGLSKIEIDPYAQMVRAGRGVCWKQVLDAASPHGLTAMHGSAPDIGVVGYCLGGGLSWYARKHGLAADSVTAVELVTANGEITRADAEHHAELFWALRGGGGANFGIVTAIELRLLPITDVYAGMMLWDISRTEQVLRVWSAWASSAPDEATTSFRVMRFPPLPQLPPFLKGRAVVLVDGAVLGTDAFAEEQLASLRATGPELDTFARIPAADLTRVHMDPENPTPAVGGGAILGELDEAGLRAFVDAAGPASSTRLLMIELRQLGGALARRPENAGALGRLDGAYALQAVGIAATPEMAAGGTAATDRLLAVLAPWANDRRFLNLTDRRVDPSTAYDEDAWRRLVAVRSEVDPHGLFLANHSLDG